MTSYPGLGFDPTPGEPGAVQTVLRQFADTGSQLAVMTAALQDALDVSDGWIGDAADDFHDNGDDLPKALADGAESMGHAADALVTWYGQLVDNKRQAEVLDRLARELRSQIGAAEQHLAAAASGARMAQGAAAGSAATAARHAYDQAAALVSSLHDQLAAVLDEAHRLQQRHLDQANATAAKLRGATGDGFEPVGGFAQAVGGVSAVMSQVSTWTGRAAFVAALVPGGQLVAGGLAAGSAVTGLAGAGGSIYAKTQHVPGLENRSYLSLGADGVLSVGAPAGRTASTLVKALRDPVRNAKNAAGSTAAAAAIGGKGAVAKDLAGGTVKRAFNGSPVGAAAKAYRDAHGADSVTDAMRRIGAIRARDAAETGVGGKVVETVVGDQVNRRVRKRLDGDG